MINLKRYKAVVDLQTLVEQIGEAPKQPRRKVPPEVRDQLMLTKEIFT